MTGDATRHCGRRPGPASGNSARPAAFSPARCILVFSQYIETRYAADLLSMRSGGVGYLLKDRVANVGEFIDVDRPRRGRPAPRLPGYVAGMRNATRHAGTLTALTAGEREVLALMAEGRLTTPSPTGSWSPSVLLKSTSATSSANWGCRPPTQTTGGSSPYSRTSNRDRVGNVPARLAAPRSRGFAFAATARHTGVVTADQLALTREELLPLSESRLGDDE